MEDQRVEGHNDLSVPLSVEYLLRWSYWSDITRLG